LRSIVSALDGILAAEKEAGVAPGRVKLTAAWSFALREGLDGKGSGVLDWGFKDFASVVKDPSIVNYITKTPQDFFELEFQRRWINCVNVQAPYAYVKAVMGNYQEIVGSVPWFIGEYGAAWQDQDTIEKDLLAMDADARDSSNPFAGSAFFQFQTSYRKGFGTERNFGIFSLGAAEIYRTGEVCNAPLFGEVQDCAEFSVQCLNTNLDGYKLPEAANHRAQAVAHAWGGSLAGPSFCSSQPSVTVAVGPRRLATPAFIV